MQSLIPSRMKFLTRLPGDLGGLKLLAILYGCVQRTLKSIKDAKSNPGFSVIFARFSDAIGRQMALLVAWILFSAFSLASGLSSSLAQLIIFRALQGIGGSGLYSMTMVVLPEVAPPRQWGLVSGLMGVVFACSSIVGMSVQTQHFNRPPTGF